MSFLALITDQLINLILPHREGHWYHHDSLFCLCIEYNVVLSSEAFEIHLPTMLILEGWEGLTGRRVSFCPTKLLKFICLQH